MMPTDYLREAIAYLNALNLTPEEIITKFNRFFESELADKLTDEARQKISELVSLINFHKNLQPVEVKDTDLVLNNTLRLNGFDKDSLDSLWSEMKELIKYDVGILDNDEIVFYKLSLFLTCLSMYHNAACAYKELLENDDIVSRGVALSKSNSHKKIIASPINTLSESIKHSKNITTETTLEVYHDYLNAPLETNYQLHIIDNMVGKDGFLNANEQKVDGLFNSMNFINSGEPIKSVKVIYYSLAVHLSEIYLKNNPLYNPKILGCKQISISKFAEIIDTVFQNLFDVNIKSKPLYSKKYQCVSIFCGAPIYKPITSKTRHIEHAPSKEFIEFLDLIFKQD